MEETYVAQTINSPSPLANEKPKKTFNKWVFVIIIATFLFLTITSGIFILNQKSTQTVNPENINNNKGVQSLTPTVIPKTGLENPVNTASWKTYKSSNGLFSLKYPSDGNWILSDSSTSTLQCLNSNCPKKYNIKNFNVQKSDFKSIQEFISSLNTTNSNLNPYIIDYKLIKINGLDAVEILTAAEPNANTGPVVSIFIVIDGIGYLYSYTYLDPNLNSVTSIDQLPDPNPNILQTLIIDGQTSTAIDSTYSWKTYTNANQGITLKYPSGWFIKSSNDINTCIKLSDSSYFGPPHAQNVISLCFSTKPITSDNPNTQITVNGYQGFRVKQTSNLGVGEKVFLLNPNGASVEIWMLLGEKNIYDLILSTFRFIN